MPCLRIAPRRDVTRRLGFVVSCAATLLCVPTAGFATPILPAPLATYAVLGASDVTCVPKCTIGGNVGSSPTPPTSTLADYTFLFGTLQPGTEGTAHTQLSTAIGAVNAFAVTATIADGNLDAYQTAHGGSIAPGVYDVGAAEPNLAGALVLNGGGSKTALWAFRFSSTLKTSTASTVSVTNVGDGSGVGLYWTAGSGATINGPTFAGNVMAGTSITSDGNLTLSCGRLLASTGNVTLIQDTISIGCAGFQASGGFDQGNDNPGAPAVPEPATLTLLATGLIGLARWKKRRQ